MSCISDHNVSVRACANAANQQIIKNFSNYAIKQVVPMFLEGLKNDNWRSKLVAVEAVGNMAYCAPKQISGFLRPMRRDSPSCRTPSSRARPSATTACWTRSWRRGGSAAAAVLQCSASTRRGRPGRRRTAGPSTIPPRSSCGSAPGCVHIKSITCHGGTSRRRGPSP